MTRGKAADAIGEKVVCSAHPGDAEEGVICSVNEAFTFVQFARGGPKAVRPEHLELAQEDKGD